MKKRVFLATLLSSMTLFFSCSLDDDTTDGGGIPIPANAIIYASSNTSNEIASFRFTAQDIFRAVHTTSSNNNEGIFYDKDNDELIVNAVDQQVVNVFSDVRNASHGAELNLIQSSSAVLENPHNVVVQEQYYIVPDSELNSEEGKILIFERDENGLELRNTVSVDYEVWGLELRGNDLFHTIPNTGDIAVFQDFISNFTTDTTAAPIKRITLEGIENIRGISANRDVFVFTDVGDTNRTNDGGVHIIDNFIEKFNAVDPGEKMIFQGNQVRIYGEASKLGNPLDAVFDPSVNGVIVAENGRNGGAVLFFENAILGGPIAPSIEFLYEGASSLTYAKLR